MTDDKGKKKRESEKDDGTGTRKKRESETEPDEPVKEMAADELSCPEGYPPDAWGAKSDRAKRAYITGIANSKKRTGA